MTKTSRNKKTAFFVLGPLLVIAGCLGGVRGKHDRSSLRNENTVEKNQPTLRICYASFEDDKRVLVIKKEKTSLLSFELPYHSYYHCENLPKIDLLREPGEYTIEVGGIAKDSRKIVIDDGLLMLEMLLKTEKEEKEEKEEKAEIEDVKDTEISVVSTAYQTDQKVRLSRDWNPDEPPWARGNDVRYRVSNNTENRIYGTSLMREFVLKLEKNNKGIWEKCDYLGWDVTGVSEIGPGESAVLKLGYERTPQETFLEGEYRIILDYCVGDCNDLNNEFAYRLIDRFKIPRENVHKKASPPPEPLRLD